VVDGDRGNHPLNMADNLKVFAVLLVCATRPLHQIEMER
jgi:hypothetical protein